MPHEILKPTLLLTPKGELAEPGWARQPYYRYNRDQIRAPFYRRKEWDYCWALTPDYGVAVTVADLGYLGLVTATTIDFRARREVTETHQRLLPRGRMGLPTSSQRGDIRFVGQPNLELHLTHTAGHRRLEISWPSFDRDRGLYGELVFKKGEPQEALVIATPFLEGRRLFYLNEKQSGLSVRGQIRYGESRWPFASQHALGGLDWGRGVWPYRCTWYWGTGAGKVDGRTLSFNIGYGFGDTSAASENLVLYDGVGHKINEITFDFHPTDSSQPWRFRSHDERLVMEMIPLVERRSHTNLLVASSRQRQCFGRFAGRAVLDDGRVLRFDDLIGFAEEVHNRW